MINMDMILKDSVEITSKHFTVENDIITLEINVGDYDLTGKQVTVVFEPNVVESTPLSFYVDVDGNNVIEIPIYASYISKGYNYMQLFFRWDDTKVENSGKLIWKIDASLQSGVATGEEQALMSYYLEEMTLAITEADRVVDEAGDVRIALDESTNNANAINDTITDPTIGTIKQATDIDATLSQTIIDGHSIEDSLNDPVTGAIAQAETAKDVIVGEINTAVGLAEDAEDDLTNPTTGAIKLANDAKGEIEQAIIDNEIVTQPEFVAHKLEYVEQRSQDQLKVAKVEKDINDYQKTMASVNVNQEAKQKVTGYGVVSLPKNTANGQVGVSLKGNTITDETGTKSTVSASRLKSVGKNLFDLMGATERGFYRALSVRDNYILKLTATGAGGRHDYTIKNLKPNTRYMLSCIKNRVSGDGGAVYVDIDGVISYPLTNINGYQKGTFTTPSNFTNISLRFYVTNSVVSGYCEFSNIQVEQNTVATPYEPYTESTQYLPNVGELSSLPNGTKDEVRVSGNKAEHIKRVSDEVVLDGSESWNFDSDKGDSLGFRKTNFQDSVAKLSSTTEKNITFNTDLIALAQTSYFYAEITKSKLTTLDFVGFKAWLQANPTTLTYQLAEPIITPIQTSGNLISYPSGTVYVENVVADAGIYVDKMTILHTDLPIKKVEKVSKVDFTTGVETDLDISECVISEDKLSFTHPSLVDGDIVFFTYYYDREGTLGETEIEYYDSRHTLKDDVTGKFYKVVPKVSDGVLVNELVEV